MKRKLNRTAKLTFFNSRKRSGDITRLAKATGYSVSHVSNVVSGVRSVPQDLANEMFNISRRRMKNSERIFA